MKEINVEAVVENIDKVTNFVDEHLEEYNCPMKAIMQINVAIDELFSNISYYAYNPDTGIATIRIEVLKDPLEVIITFIDNGRPYNPLEKGDPNITGTAEEREIGGLRNIYCKKIYGRY